MNQTSKLFSIGAMSVKKKHKKGMVGKAKKGKVVVVHRSDRKLSVCKTIKYQLNIEKKV